MQSESIFVASTFMTIAGWLLIAILPRWRYTQIIVLSGGLSLVLAGAYAALAAVYFTGSGGGFGSLADFMKLFDNEWVALAGWMHYLAFDLFVGSWEVRDAQERNVSHLWVIPCLMLTFTLGPVGLLAYSIVRLFPQPDEDII